MKVNKIEYPVPISQIKDIENDNIDVFIELEDGFRYSLVVSTPKNLIWYMDKEETNYINAGPPLIIVRALTEENIKKAIELYAAKDAYWLKLYYLAGQRNGIFSISAMDKLIMEIRADNEEILSD